MVLAEEWESGCVSFGEESIAATNAVFVSLIFVYLSQNFVALFFIEKCNTIFINKIGFSPLHQ